MFTVKILDPQLDSTVITVTSIDALVSLISDPKTFGVSFSIESFTENINAYTDKSVSGIALRCDYTDIDWEKIDEALTQQSFRSLVSASSQLINDDVQLQINVMIPFEQIYPLTETLSQAIRLWATKFSENLGISFELLVDEASIRQPLFNEEDQAPYLFLFGQDREVFSMASHLPSSAQIYSDLLDRKAWPSEDVEILAARKAFIEGYLMGHPPMVVSGRFYVFQERIWKHIPTDQMKSLIYRSVFASRGNKSLIGRLIEDMRLQFTYLGSSGDGDENVQFPGLFYDRNPTSQTKTLRIALSNGTVDPLDSEIVYDSPEWLIRSKLPYDFDRHASCERWKSVLQDIFGCDDDRDAKISCIQEFFGYSLIPSTHHQKLLFLIGNGANGKSVVLETLRQLVGACNVSNVSMGELGERFNLAQFDGKLLNIDDDMPVNKVLSDAKLKKLVSGAPMQVERKGQDPYTMTPFVRLIAAGNVMPRTNDTSHGFLRRIIVINFNRTFSPEEQDKRINSELALELPGIFNWALEGLRRLEAQKSFTRVPSSEQSISDYTDESDPLRLFMEQHLVRDSKERTQKGNVYAAYKAFCETSGYLPSVASIFGKQLKEFGIDSAKSNGNHYYTVGLKSEGAPRAQLVEA